MPVLTHQEAQELYDRFGSRQDRQGFYEDVACADLRAHAGFDQALSVFEFGCGTGRFAEELLSEHLPADSHYVGVDISATMVGLSLQRLEPWAGRVEVRQSDGAMCVTDAEDLYDCFVCNYVLDLLSEEDILKLLAEAHRTVKGNGRLCLISLTHGNTWPSHLLSSAWQLVHAIKPQRVGGCRPLRLRGLLSADRWQIEHHHVVSRWAVSSEVLIARCLKEPVAGGPVSDRHYPW
ncbi:MAG: class I SAM-dependent methyltransferase [Acidobacteriota bacterium]